MIALDDELVRIAGEYGISRKMYRQRIEDGWDAEDAAFQPPDDIAVTKELIAMAEAKGIPRGTLTYRIYTRGMGIKEALETPKEVEHGKWSEYLKRAKANGVPAGTFYSRVNIYRMSPEDACKPGRSNALPEEFHRWQDVAVSNGIKAGTFYNRVSRGWSMEEAATKPIDVKRIPRKVRDKKDLSYWKKVAELNGIKAGTFYNRVNLGWSPEQASTIPKGKGRLREKGSFYEWSMVAESNGVNYNAFTRRVKELGWSLEESATTPILRRKRI